MKLAIISDAHLLQTYTEVFDPIEDFINVTKEIKKQNPDAILFAENMFDKRKTRKTRVLHPEGEQALMRVRPVLADADSPIYAIRGNHEDPRVLNGLDQTVENFHHVSDAWITVDDFSIYGLETRYERTRDKSQLEKEIEEIASELGIESIDGKNMLLCHETFIPSDKEFPPELRSILSSEFELILNGHLHYYDPNPIEGENIIFLPALLPSKLHLGNYWQESYEWPSEDQDFNRLY